MENKKYNGNKFSAFLSALAVAAIAFQGTAYASDLTGYNEIQEPPVTSVQNKQTEEFAQFNLEITNEIPPLEVTFDEEEEIPATVLATMMMTTMAVIATKNNEDVEKA